MRVVRYFPDSDMRNGHAGLFKLAFKNGVDVRKIGNGEFIIFVNRKKTHIKMYAANHVIAHYKSPGQKIDPRVIQHLPNVFSGGDINYDKAMVRVLKREFPKYDGEVNL